MKRSIGLSICLVAGMILTAFSPSLAAKPERTVGKGTGSVVFVTSQGLYYDSIVVVVPLPQKGRFQQLVPTENGLTTQYGPG